jgi:two-component system, chemotaxis family, protein-glutamate methylesterase/glutaminase
MAAEPKTYAPGALRVLIVDDLRFMCIALRQIVEADGDMRVVGEARNGEEACALAHDLKPDVITMDIEMPVMDGIEATGRILAEVRPAPVIIMVSSYTQAGAAATIEALRLGAADFVSKESTFAKTDLGHIDAELRAKIRLCASRRRNALVSAGAPHEEVTPLPEISPDEEALSGRIPGGSTDLVAIAASTGGPVTLTTLLQAVGRIAAPIVVAQHMPEFFTSYLAQSLSHDTGLHVREGSHREPILAGEVTILPGGKDALVAPRGGGGFELRLTEAEGAVHPSANALFESVAMAARRPVAVILTGMGNDGTRGATRFARRNLPVLVQRPDTCVIDGMPSAAIEAGVASESLTITEIARRLRRWAPLAAAESYSDQPEVDQSQVESAGPP